MMKKSNACISILILLTLISGANAIAVENLKTLNIPETDVWDVVSSPDGTQIAFIAYDEKRTQQIFIINANGTGEKKITDDSNKKWGLAWGKDKMAYISFGKSGLEKVFVINPDGTGSAELIQDNTRQGNFERYMTAWGAPSWSHDGSLLVYTSLDDKGEPKVFLVNSDGTGKKLVVEDSFKQWSPYFSPDEKSIVYVSYPDTKYKQELFTVEISGNGRKQLTSDELKKNYPVWGPDGTIVYVSYESVTSSGDRLFAINQDGTNKRLFLDRDFREEYPSFSRDGRKFTYFGIDISGNFKINVGDVTGIKSETTPSITTPPAGKTPAGTSTVKETAGTGEEKKPVPALSIVSAIAVIFVLALLMRKKYP